MNKKLIVALFFSLCALLYVGLAPFEPVSFFSLLAVAIIYVVWSITWLLKDWKSQKTIKG